MTDTKAAISLWDISAEEKKVDNPMTGDIQAEVAIVGGGFTGLSTALHLGEKGVEAHVLEAETIGHGGSGRNAGLLNAGVWLPPQDVRKELGEEPGTPAVCPREPSPVATRLLAHAPLGGALSAEHQRVADAEAAAEAGEEEAQE